MRNLLFKGSSFKDFIDWYNLDKKIFLRIVELIEEIRRTPFEGKGKPEPLKHQLAGKWSRKIDDVHRIVYEVKENTIEIVSCRYHYK